MDHTKVDLSAADVQLIDFGCSGPNGQHYAATVKYAPLEIWRNNITDETSKTLIFTETSQTLDSDTTKFLPRKHGSKYDTWSTMITIWEFIIWVTHIVGQNRGVPRGHCRGQIVEEI